MAAEYSVQLTKGDGPDVAGPALFRFPAGLPHYLTDRDETSFRILQNTAPEKSSQKLVWADSEFVHYEARKVKKPARRFAIACVNAESQQAHVFEADLFSMRQCVQGIDDVDPEDFTDPSESSNIGTKKRTLFDTFGSKKKQRQLRSTAASQVKPEDASSLGALSVALEQSAQIEMAEVKADSMLNTDILPPYNMDTSVLEQIYPFSGIVPDDVNELLDWHPFLKAIGQDQSRYPLTVVDLAGRLGSDWKQTSAQVREQRGRAILMLFFLMRFATLPRFVKAHDQVEARLENVPCMNDVQLACVFDAAFPSMHQKPAVVEHLLNTFAQAAADGSGWSRSRPSQDKLQVFICVCALWASGTFDLTRNTVLCMCDDLKLVETALNTFFRQVGCTVSKPKGGDANENAKLTQIKLKAPLSFPKMSMGRAKK